MNNINNIHISFCLKEFDVLIIRIKLTIRRETDLSCPVPMLRSNSEININGIVDLVDFGSVMNHYKLLTRLSKQLSCTIY